MIDESGLWIMLWLNILWLIILLYYNFFMNHRDKFPKYKSVRSQSGPVQAERPVFLGPDQTDRTNPTLVFALDCATNEKNR